MLKKIIICYSIFFAFTSCNQEYKAGNLVELGYPIETPMRTKIIRQYVDTLIIKNGYNVPMKWQKADKLVNLDSINHKRIYFKEGPEEMYLISLSGMLVLSDVYNPKIKQGDWVAEESAMPKAEELRVKKRFKNEILDTIEALAKRDGLSDSVMYK